MKHVKLILAVFAGVMLASQAFAFNVASNTDGSFSLTGPANNFTNWAVDGGATTTGGWSTYTASDYPWMYMSGPATTQSISTIMIPFVFDAPLATARLDYTATMLSYGSNWGYVKMWVDSTQIFAFKSDRTEFANYNYTASQTPTEAGDWRGYTDISALVAGKNSFTLNIECMTGWSSTMFNGGVVMTTWTHQSDPDFYLTGTTAAVPEPASILGLCAGLGALIPCIRRRK